jgi:hypothetical protein
VIYELDGSAAIADVERRLKGYPALLEDVIHKAIKTVNSTGRKHLVDRLMKILPVRWPTIIKRRVLYKRESPNVATITLYDEPIELTSFKGQWSNKNYVIEVVKGGMTVVVPNAFKGKSFTDNDSNTGHKGGHPLLAVFSRDVDAPSRRQTVGHYKGNIGRMRKPTHRARPIMMSTVLANKPDIIPDETAFLQKMFEKALTNGANRALGVKA